MDGWDVICTDSEGRRYSLVGERGPELVNFSGGGVVLPNPDVRRFLDTDGPDE